MNTNYMEKHVKEYIFHVSYIDSLARSQMIVVAMQVSYLASTF